MSDANLEVMDDSNLEKMADVKVKVEAVDDLSESAVGSEGNQIEKDHDETVKLPEYDKNENTEGKKVFNENDAAVNVESPQPTVIKRSKRLMDKRKKSKNENVRSKKKITSKKRKCTIPPASTKKKIVKNAVKKKEATDKNSNSDSVETSESRRPKRKCKRESEVTNCDDDIQDESKLKLDGSYDSDDGIYLLKKGHHCNICDKKFQHPYSIIRHLKNIHKIKDRRTYYCWVCDKVFVNEKLLNEHKKTHKRCEYSHLCDKCGMSFKNNAHLKAHVQAIHTPRAYKCTFEGCSKMFATSSNRRKHENAVHLDIRKYVCDKCSKAFNTSSILKAHIFAIHMDASEKTRFECNVCKKKFFSKIHVKEHETIHSGIKPYQCTIPGCTVTFRNKSNRNKHVKMHKGEKPYECHICKDRFTRQYYLDSHMYKHTGKKMYSCEICSKSFTQKGNLTHHMILHSDKRVVYKCTECDRSFNHKCNYTKHMQNHADPAYTPSPIKRKRKRTRDVDSLKTEVEDEVDDEKDIDMKMEKESEESGSDTAKSNSNMEVVTTTNVLTENNTIKIVINCMPADGEKNEQKEINTHASDKVDMDKVLDSAENEDAENEEDNVIETNDKDQIHVVQEIPLHVVDFSNMEVTPAEVDNISDIIHEDYTEIIQTSTKGAETLENALTVVEAQMIEGKSVQVFLSDVVKLGNL